MHHLAKSRFLLTYFNDYAHPNVSNILRFRYAPPQLKLTSASSITEGSRSIELT